MNSSFPRFRPPSEHRGRKPRALFRRRIIIAALVALALHLILFFGIAPLIELGHLGSKPLEVVQISPQELNKMKQQILQKNKFLPPALKQEMHEEYRTKEAPKDAHFMGAFNQTVPKETVAGPQPDQPLDGGGGAQQRAMNQAAKQAQQQQKLARTNQHVTPQTMNLSQIGLGTKLPTPRPPEEAAEERQHQESG